MAEAHAKAEANAEALKKNGWTLTSKEWQNKISAVILPDGIHPVLYGSFTVEDAPEDGYAVWQEHDEFAVACPLSSIVALRVRRHKSEIVKP